MLPENERRPLTEAAPSTPAKESEATVDAATDERTQRRDGGAS